MRDQRAWQLALQRGRRELRELVGVAVEVAGARAMRPALRPGRAALAAPVHRPHRYPPRRKVAERLELLFDEVAEPADEDAFGAGLPGGEMPPAQHRAIGGRKRAPDKTRRGLEALRECRRPPVLECPRHRHVTIEHRWLIHS